MSWNIEWVIALVEKEARVLMAVNSCSENSFLFPEERRITPMTLPRALSGAVSNDTMPSSTCSSGNWIRGSSAQSSTMTTCPLSASETLFSASTGPLSRNFLLRPKDATWSRLLWSRLRTRKWHALISRYLTIALATFSSFSSVPRVELKASPTSSKMRTQLTHSMLTTDPGRDLSEGWSAPISGTLNTI